MVPYRRLALVLCLCLCAAVFATTLGGARAQPGAAIEPDRRVLVMLRLVPEHHRPGGDYGDSYGDGVARGELRRTAGRIAKAHGLTLLDDWPMPLLGLDCFVMAAPDGRSATDVAASLSSDPGVSWSEPMQVYHAEGRIASHNDPLYPIQPAAREWRLADLHEHATGRNVTVAVIDSMVDRAQPDLVGQVRISENFVPGRPSGPESHGTGVAGIVAAKADNGVGIAGVAPQARLMALRACWQTSAATVCDTLSLAQALEFAVEHRAEIINLSLAGPPAPLLGKLLDAALARGVVVVSAFDRDLPRGGFPSSHPGVVSVVAESPLAIPSGAFAAPGRDVPTTEPGARWALVNGSSYAAAHVSGLFALMRERRRAPGLSLALVTARSGGAIDACATLMRASRSGDCTDAPAREELATARP